MALQLWDTLKEAIVAYSGLSPATFFTFLALLFAVYHVISGLFVSSAHHHPTPRVFEEQMQPPAPPVQVGEITKEELKVYDGSDPEKPLLMAIKGQIYDVSQGRYKVVLLKLHYYYCYYYYHYYREAPGLFLGILSSACLFMLSTGAFDAGSFPFALNLHSSWEFFLSLLFVQKFITLSPQFLSLLRAPFYKGYFDASLGVNNLSCNL